MAHQLSCKNSVFFFLYLFLQLLLDLLSFSGVSFSALARFPVYTDKLSMDIVEKFLVEQLNLIKDSISHIKVLINCTVFPVLIFVIIYSNIGT